MTPLAMDLAVGRPGFTGAPRSGPSRLARAEVKELQRNRLIAAAAEVVHELGGNRLSVESIIGQARMSRRTFYEIFSDREDCFLAVFERTVANAREVAQKSYAQHDTWRAGVRCALRALLVLMDQEPALARLCVVDALTAGESVIKARCEVLDGLAAVIDEGRSSPGSQDPPAVTAEATVGGILAVVHSRLVSDDRQPLSALSGDLMSMIMLPYRGPRAARQELAHRSPLRPTPPPANGDANDSLKDLRIRLTYRTVRTLIAISEHPGASNRHIAQAAGIIDQGQISKLLSRLERLELIANLGAGQPKGAANAWSLTARGTHLASVARPT
jgi:AcrR family transcriptional regulator